MRLVKEFAAFIIPSWTSGTMQLTLLIAGMFIAIAFVAPPIMGKAVQVYASNSHPGVDEMTTGSIKPVKRYVVRKSVLDEEYR